MRKRSSDSSWGSTDGSSNWGSTDSSSNWGSTDDNSSWKSTNNHSSWNDNNDFSGYSTNDVFDLPTKKRSRDSIAERVINAFSGLFSSKNKAGNAQNNFLLLFIVGIIIIAVIGIYAVTHPGEIAALGKFFQEFIAQLIASLIISLLIVYIPKMMFGLNYEKVVEKALLVTAFITLTLGKYFSGIATLGMIVMVILFGWVAIKKFFSIK